MKFIIDKLANIVFDRALKELSKNINDFKFEIKKEKYRENIREIIFSEYKDESFYDDLDKVISNSNIIKDIILKNIDTKDSNIVIDIKETCRHLQITQYNASIIEGIINRCNEMSFDYFNSPNNEEQRKIIMNNIKIIQDLKLSIKEYLDDFKEFVKKETNEIKNILVDEAKEAYNGRFRLTEKEINESDYKSAKKKIYFLKNDREESFESENVIFDLMSNDIKNCNYRNYIISGNGYSGKSFEMKKTVKKFYKLKYENINEDKLYLIPNMAFFDLRTFDEFETIKEICKKNKYSKIYIFLDSLDECSDSDRESIYKKISEYKRIYENIYFVISSRKLSLNNFNTENIFGKEETTYCNLECNIENILEITNPDLKDKTVFGLLEYKYNFEYKKHNITNEKQFTYEKYYDIFGNFSLKLLRENKNEWNDSYIKNYLKKINEADNIKNEVQKIISESIWIKKNNEKSGDYQFEHKSNQEYLIARRFSNYNEIPSMLVYGENKDLILEEYVNIFIFWHNFLKNDNEKNNEELYKKIADNILVKEENINTLLSSDITYLEKEHIEKILKIIVNNLDKINNVYNFFNDNTDNIVRIFKSCGIENENMLYKKIINKIQSGDFSYLYRYINIFIKLIQKENIEKAKEIVKEIFKSIERKNNKLKEYSEIMDTVLFLDMAIKEYENDFSSYDYIKSLNLEIDKIYKSAFYKDQIIYNFYFDYGKNIKNDPEGDNAIKKHKDNILSVLKYLLENNRISGASWTVVNYIDDNYKKPEAEITDSGNVLIEFFLMQFIKPDYMGFQDFQDRKVLIPTENIRDFIIEAFDKIINSMYVEIYDQKSMFKNTLKILYEIIPNLSKSENEKLLNAVKPQLISGKIYAYYFMGGIIDKIPNEYKDIWFDEIIDSIKENNIDIKNYYSVIRYPLSLTYKENAIKNIDKFKNYFVENEELYKDFLLQLRYKLGIDIFTKEQREYYLKHYNHVEEELERKNNLSKKLKIDSINNLEKEIESLFNKELFKNDCIKIIEHYKLNKKVEISDRKIKIFFHNYTLRGLIIGVLYNDMRLDFYPSQIAASYLSAKAKIDNNHECNNIDEVVKNIDEINEYALTLELIYYYVLKYDRHNISAKNVGKLKIYSDINFLNIENNNYIDTLNFYRENILKEKKLSDIIKIIEEKQDYLRADIVIAIAFWLKYKCNKDIKIKDETINKYIKNYVKYYLQYIYDVNNKDVFYDIEHLLEDDEKIIKTVKKVFNEYIENKNIKKFMLEINIYI